MQERIDIESGWEVESIIYFFRSLRSSIIDNPVYLEE